jgi:basic amino acid/polyamine antiporter, APA family
VEQDKSITPSRAVAIVVSNMIGTGVYTSLGLQALGINSILALLFIWITGGLVALCGALTYGELAARMPRSGGEYVFLSRIYHRSIGFMSGFISMTIGFAAPMAIAAIALGTYARNLIPVPPLALAVAVIVILAMVNLSSFKTGVNFNFVTTGLNILLILSFCLIGFLGGRHDQFLFTLQAADFKQIFSPSFAVSLVYVSFAYSGWNSATYITHQIKDPVRNLPRILITGTLIVMALYTLLNFVFLYTVPLADLKGKVDVAFISAKAIFGLSGGKFVAALISIGLIASINSLLIFGPRVTQALAQDYRPLRGLGRENRHGTPFAATLLLTAAALALILTSTFEQIMTLLGFTLSLFTIMAVLGVIVLRTRMKKNGEPFYHTFGYPAVPVFFILVEGSMAVYVFINKPKQALIGLAIALAGLAFFLFLRSREEKPALKSALPG